MESSDGLRYVDAILAAHGSGLATAFARDLHWGYWPQPSARSTSPEDFARAAARLTHRFCDVAEIRNGQRVLDVGCGIGGTLATMNDRFEDVVLDGLNIDQQQLAVARRKVVPQPVNGIHFSAGDACRLPYRDRKFDVVLCLEAIFHFPDREHFFREVRRVLKPGGMLAITDFVPSPLLAPMLRLAKDSAYERNLREVSGSVDMTVTADGYRLLAQSTGFDCIQQDDISRNVAPSVPMMRELTRVVVRQTSGSRLKEVSADIGMRIGELAMRAGLVSYMILVFKDRRHAGHRS